MPIFALILTRNITIIFVPVIFHLFPLMLYFFHEFIDQLTFCLGNILIVHFVGFGFGIGQTEMFIQLLTWYFWLIFVCRWFLFCGFLKISKTARETVVLLDSELVVELLNLGGVVGCAWEVHFVSIDKLLKRTCYCLKLILYLLLWLIFILIIC